MTQQFIVGQDKQDMTGQDKIGHDRIKQDKNNN